MQRLHLYINYDSCSDFICISTTLHQAKASEAVDYKSLKIKLTCLEKKRKLLHAPNGAESLDRTCAALTSPTSRAHTGKSLVYVLLSWLLLIAMQYIPTMAPRIIDDELIDDSVDENLIVGLKEPLSLKKRFLYRLGHLLGTNVEVFETENVLVIYISPCSVPQNKHQAGAVKDRNSSLRQFSADLQDTLSKLVRSEDGK